MDPPVDIPRWSPTKALRITEDDNATNNSDVDSDGDHDHDHTLFPLSGMATNNPAVDVPIRWTPSPTPTRPLMVANEPSLTNKKLIDHQATKKKTTFPFSAGPSSASVPPPPHVNSIRSSVGGDLEFSGSIRMEGGVPVVLQKGVEAEFGEPRKDENNTGIFLTWNDLWVTVPEKKGGRRPILQGLTGYVEPGEVLAIMGPSGCGKSTLLDTLAGRLSSNTRQSGDIFINGRKQTLAFGTSAYVTQDDTLMTTLTVREAVYYSAQLQLPDSMSRSEKRERAETTIRDMGLQDAMNTRIGGWSVKGLSGGQKRRVSICIEILTRPKLLFLDEPTSGLDSAASYHVMNRIIKLAQLNKRTVIASIHQPSGEVFDLFHNLCLLSSGRTVYFGSAVEANEFFASNGFPCPTMRNPSDHFLRTINKDFDVETMRGVGGCVSASKAIDILVNSFESSEAHQQVINKVYEICQKNEGAIEEKRAQASFVTQCIVLTRRSFVNMYRDLGYYWLRLVIYVALALCIGTIFYDVGMDYGSIQARASMLMFIAAFLTFMAIGGFPSFVEDMKIFSRERLNGHYGVGAFVVGNTISSTPYLLMNCVIPGVITYYLVGLQKGINHFGYFVILLYSCMLVVESLMMIVASVVPDFLLGIITGAGIQGIMMLNGGYFRLPNDLPKPFWRYPMYYISFHKYGFQGFYKNEYIGLTFPNEIVGGPPTINGEEILKSVWQVQMGYSKWVDLGILFGMIILYRFLFFGIIKLKEKMKPVIDALKMASCVQAEDPSSITRSSEELGCSVRRVRAFSVLDCNCYTVDLTFPD